MQMFLRLRSNHEVFLFAIENFSYEGITHREQRFIKDNENLLVRKCMENDNSLFAISYPL